MEVKKYTVEIKTFKCRNDVENALTYLVYELEGFYKILKEEDVNVS